MRWGWIGRGFKSPFKEQGDQKGAVQEGKGEMTVLKLGMATV